MTNVQEYRVDDERRGKKQGRWSLRNLKELLVGAKDRFFGVDSRGLWLGSRDYDDAPFRVNMRGEIEAATLDTDIVTAKSVVTSTTGQRVEIQDTTNTVRFFNSANDLVLQFMGVTDYTQSQVNITGGMQLKADEDINYDSGIRIVPFGSGSSIAAIFESFNREKGNNEAARLLIVSNGRMEFQGTDGLPVFIVDNDGNVSCNRFLPNLPTSNPNNPGELWNDNGTVKVS
jgi:hypothetical protein